MAHFEEAASAITIHSGGAGSCFYRVAVGRLLHHGEGSNFWIGNRCDRGWVLLMLLRYKINPAFLVVAGAIIGVFSFIPK
jgi:hypothetical protein